MVHDAVEVIADLITEVFPIERLSQLGFVGAGVLVHRFAFQVYKGESLVSDTGGDHRGRWQPKPSGGFNSTWSRPTKVCHNSKTFLV